jgi:hypothetical protein
MSLLLNGLNHKKVTVSKGNAFLVTATFHGNWATVPPPSCRKVPAHQGWL